jgi:hypothetical protein
MPDMTGRWQDSWTFRIVDQDTGASVSGVPVALLDDGGRSAGVWVSDVDGTVRIPKHDRPRLRLRVGLHNDDVIDLDARTLPDEPVPIVAPHTGSEVAAEPSLPPPSQLSAVPAPFSDGGHLLRFARIGVLRPDADVTETAAADRARFVAVAADPSVIRYGVVFEVEQVWQSLGSRAGDLLYSVSLGPGEEVKVAVQDGRWRKKPDARERPLQIVAKMVAARLVGDGLDVTPLEPFIVPDLAAAAADTVRYLDLRTVRAGEALRHRPLGVTQLEADKPAGATVRTVRNMRSDGVLTYHFIEPVESYRVVVRTPRPRPAILVPFRLPNIATREVVCRFGHALRRALLDRAFLPDIEQVLAADAPPAAAERRLYAHIMAHLAYYSATIIAAGDPSERFFALAKLRDSEGRALSDVIENTVVGRVGNYVAFPLRSLEYTTPAWRAALAVDTVQRLRAYQESVVTLPVPGVWLRAQLSPAAVQSVAEEDSAAQGSQETPRGGRRPGRRG